MGSGTRTWKPIPSSGCTQAVYDDNDHIETALTYEIMVDMFMDGL